MHSINYMLLQFFAATGQKGFDMQQLKQLATLFDDEHIECHISICARVEAKKCLVANIDHTFKIDICTATV